MTDDELDEAYRKCWCEQDLDGPIAEYPNDYKEDHMIYEPNREQFSPFSAFMSVMLCAVIITLLIGLFG